MNTITGRLIEVRYAISDFRYFILATIFMLIIGAVVASI